MFDFCVKNKEGLPYLVAKLYDLESLYFERINDTNLATSSERITPLYRYSLQRQLEIDYQDLIAEQDQINHGVSSLKPYSKADLRVFLHKYNPGTEKNDYSSPETGI